MNAHLPPTSLHAYREIEPHGDDLRARIFSAILHAADGMTCEECERATGLKHTTTSARIYELAGKGKKPRPAVIVDSGRTRRTESGRAAIVWLPVHPVIARQTSLMEALA